MIIWGFNFVMIKLAVSEVNPLLMTAARFTLAALPIVFFVRKPNVQWRYLVSYGVVFGVGIWGMVSWSITAGMSSGMTSVLLQSNVLISMAVGVFIMKEQLTKRKLLGAAIATCALLISILFTNGNVTGFGLVLVAISAASWTLLGVIVKASKTVNPFAFNVWGMLFTPLPLVVLAIGLHGEDVISQSIMLWNWNTSIAVVFQAYPTTLFGYWIWNKMLIKYPLSTVAPLTLLVPVFGLISGYLVYGEMLSLAQVIACSLFLLGINLIVRKPNKVAQKLAI
jgi:O-acetylserine/cysteine efflux transporter